MSNIIGNEEVIARAKALFTSIPCNAVFLGVKGVGKFTVAKELLSEFSEVLTVDGEEFNTEACNTLLTKLSIVPAGTEKRVVLIDNASSISDVVQSKLLKVVEDEQKYNIFVFIAHDALLSTIMSRCMIFRFWPVIDTDSFLLEQGVKEEDFGYYSLVMQGSIGNYFYLKGNEVLNELCRSVYSLYCDDKVSSLELLRIFGLVNEKSTAFDALEPELDFILRFLNRIWTEINFKVLGLLESTVVPVPKGVGTIAVSRNQNAIQSAIKLHHKVLFTKQDLIKLLHVLGSC